MAMSTYQTGTLSACPDVALGLKRIIYGSINQNDSPREGLAENL
jgi:hypothetical protein